ncbi:MAG TPA: APC family permease [Acidobacteriaceae bacterium]|nr:APC family permease [Acidobacteriaceae bacterium]HUB18566.1 APC family permease [Acidobacteriaceae bacterium]
MRLLPLIAATFFMVSGGPYGIEDILGAGYLKGLIILLALPLLWSLPTALMIGELASALPEEGGFYVWVRRAMGPFWGYQEAWLSLAASIFDMAIYPTLFVLYLGRLFPAWTAGWHGIAWELGLIALCCIWNLLGAPAVGGGSVGLFVLLLSPFAVLVVAALWNGSHLPAHIAWSRSGDAGGLSTAILVAMWNYMGWDNASTVAREVDDPCRNYPRAMVASAALVTVTYVIPLAAMAWAGVPADSFSTGSWADVARTMVGPWLGMAIVVGGTLTSVGMFNALTMSYARLPMVLAEDHMLPSLLARKNGREVPWVAVLACAVSWALALRFSFERLISIDLILYGSSLILEFIALVVLRLREPALERPFRAGSFVTACVIGAIPTGLILYADFASRREHIAHMPALVLGGLIAACGPLLYSLSRIRRRRRPEQELPAAAD